MMRSAAMLALSLLIIVSAASPTAAADLKILLPLGRVTYQTNEWIDIWGLRTSPEPLPSSTLTLVVIESPSPRRSLAPPAAQVARRECR